ncbi:MAG: hypothetical protein PVI03_01545 [Candidatus Thorarchaeota archaeon]|jgi:hypothetical protein
MAWRVTIVTASGEYYDDSKASYSKAVKAAKNYIKDGGEFDDEDRTVFVNKFNVLYASVHEIE